MLVLDEQREMLEKFRGRIEDIYERELVRLVRLKGLEIEDERAKTYFMCSVGYLARAELEREKLKELLTGEWVRITELLSKTVIRIKQYNHLLQDIKEDAHFGGVVKRFKLIDSQFSIGFYDNWTFRFSIDNKLYRSTGYTSDDRRTLKQILQDIMENYEHLMLSIIGKVVSGK